MKSDPMALRKVGKFFELLPMHYSPLNTVPVAVKHVLCFKYLPHQKDSHASCDLSLVHCHQPYQCTHSDSESKRDETAAQLRSNRFFSN